MVSNLFEVIAANKQQYLIVPQRDATVGEKIDMRS